MSWQGVEKWKKYYERPRPPVYKAKPKTMSHQNVQVECFFDTAIRSVWKALTEKDLMKEWYIKVDDFKTMVGFKFEFWGGEENERKWKHLCEITEVVPEKRLTYSWKYKGYSGLSSVTFELFEQTNGTKLKLTHSGIETFPSNLPELTISNFENGWNQAINHSLKEFLEK